MPVSSTELRQITDDVWQYTLNLPVADAAHTPMGGGTLAARVRIHGPWEGSVILRCSPGTARRWALAMFAKRDEETTAEEVRDALGELANMIAGNIKGILDGQFQLSLPVVAEWYLPEEPRVGRVVGALDLESVGERFQVTLLELVH